MSVASEIAYLTSRISLLETHLLSAKSLLRSAGSDTTSITYAERLEEELTKARRRLGRLDGSDPMIVRGVTRGLNVR